MRASGPLRRVRAALVGGKGVAPARIHAGQARGGQRIALHLLPFAFIAAEGAAPVAQWVAHGADGEAAESLQAGLFGAAASVVFSLIAQVGEQVGYLRFLPSLDPAASRRARWA